MKQATQTFKALSDETRLRILGLLREGELCVCDLVAVLDLPQSTISRHLAYLKNSGLVKDRREGVWMHYRLSGKNEAATRRLKELLRLTVGGLDQVRKDRQSLRRHISDQQTSACS